MIAIEKMIAANRADCCGCYGCYNACPFEAITMAEDEEGFRYPRVDAECCRNCGKCERTCPVLNPIEREQESTPVTYAAINKDEAVRADSSSGGMFHLFAEQVLAQGGIVFGAGFDANWEVCHQSVERVDDLGRLRVSKYLQSRIETTFQQVAGQLRQGRRVLFAGTPCQCAALRRFVGKNDENLVLVDFICHGVPSPKIWRNYLALRARKKEIRRISFRNKNLSWERYLLAISYGNANKYLAADLNTDLYLRGFLQNLYLRPSCHSCHFCKKNRPSDITLADFWGVQEESPDMYDGKGTSLIFIQSQKGKALFQQVQDRARIKEQDFAKAIRHNPSMIQPSTPSPKRAAFFRDIQRNEMDFMKLLYSYTKPPFKAQVKQWIRKVPGTVAFIHMIKGKR